MENTQCQIFKSGWHLASHPHALLTGIREMRKPLQLELIVLLIFQVASWAIIFGNNHFSFAPDLTVIGLVSLFSGITNILSVVFDSDCNMTNFFWGILNNITYIYVSFQANLYGEVYLYIYFFISQFVGIYLWHKRNLRHPIANHNEVQVKELSLWGWAGVTIIVLVGWLLLGFFLLHVPLLTPTLDPLMLLVRWSSVGTIFID